MIALADAISTGIDFSDKIAIVKYGHVFRGLKVKGESSS